MKTVRTISTALFLIFILGSARLLAAAGEDVSTQNRQVPSFTGVKVGGAFEVVLKQGDSYAVVVEADADLINDITTEVSDNILKIGIKSSHDHWNHDSHTMRVTITYKDLTSLDLSGAVEVKTANKLNGKELNIDCSGAAEVTMDLAVQSLDMTVSGAAELKLTGNTGQCKMDASGAAELHCGEFVIGDLTLYGSGAVEAKVNVNGSLKANVSGACTVKYLGNPRVDVHSSGASTIKRAD